MKYWQWLMLLIATMTTCSTKADNADSFKIDRNGVISIDQMELFIHHFDRAWQGASAKTTSLLVKNVSGNIADYRLQANLITRQNEILNLEEKITTVSTDRIRYQVDVTAAKPVATEALTVNMQLPVDRFAGKSIRLDGKRDILVPMAYDDQKGSTLYKGEVSQLIIPGNEGVLVISGKLKILIQDDRKWETPDKRHNSRITLRLSFDPENGAINRATIAFELAFRPYRSTPIDLRSGVNMNFRDDVANDSHGGWTDQGPQNDLRMIVPGAVRLYGVDFNIIDPAKNHEKSCLVMAGPDRDYLPKAAEFAVDDIKNEYLYVLHALAWPPSEAVKIGNITVSYRNGSQTIIPVTANVDVGNWWEPVPRPNGQVVWTGENKSSYVGLYRSIFKIKPEPIKSIRFETAKNAVWAVAAVSASDYQIPNPVITPTYITTGKDWKPITNRRDVKKGSVLDFSGQLDAPAGKYGMVTIREGKLVFAARPEIPVRFYGTNLCSTASFLDKRGAEQLAERLAANGYNAVRIHHHDYMLSLRTKNKSTDLNLQNADQLDYLIYCLKQRGIYISTDLYVSRRLIKGEIAEFPDRELIMSSFKSLAFVCPAVLDNWEEFTRNWMTHVNPYTGLALKDDPVLMSISLINEDNIGHVWKKEPWVAEYYQQKFAAWLAARKLTADEPDRRLALFTQFLFESYNTAFRRMKDFARKIGIRCIITDQNMQEQPILALMREQYDYVDMHPYWDHPSFPITDWQLPSSSNNVSVLARAAEVPARGFPTRIFHKPMMITEFDYARPNFNRAEGGVLMGAYASLQDWDAMFHFAYSHRSGRLNGDSDVAGHFDAATDIVKALSQRIGILLFLSHQVEAAKAAVAIPVSTIDGKDFAQRYPNDIFKLGLILQVGSVVAKDGRIAAAALPSSLLATIDIENKRLEGLNGVPAFNAVNPSEPIIDQMLKSGILQKEWIDPAHGIFRSATGQLELNQQMQTFKVTTPGIEVFILPEKQKMSGTVMAVDNREGRGVFSVAAMDGKPLRSSNHLLLFHLTDTQNSKVKFGNRAMTLMDTWGEAPQLARKGLADVTLTGMHSGKWRLFAVDTSGERLREIPIALADGILRFTLDVFSGNEPTMTYELIRD